MIKQLLQMVANLLGAQFEVANDGSASVSETLYTISKKSPSGRNRYEWNFNKDGELIGYDVVRNETGESQE